MAAIQLTKNSAEIGENLTFEPDHLETCVIPLLRVIWPQGLQFWHYFCVMISFWPQKYRWLPSDWPKILPKSDNCPELHGYNTKLSREQGHLPQPKTKVLYLPLIDMKPSDPDMMLIAMMRVKELTAQTGQTFSLYMWPTTLQSCCADFMGPAGNFQRYVPSSWWNARSDEPCGGYWVIDDWKKAFWCSFRGVWRGPKMLSGKKFPQNVRAFRMMAEMWSTDCSWIIISQLQMTWWKH